MTVNHHKSTPCQFGTENITLHEHSTPHGHINTKHIELISKSPKVLTSKSPNLLSLLRLRTISSPVDPYKIIEFHPDTRQRIIWEGTEAQGKIMSKQDQSPAGKTQNSGTHVQHLGLMASSML